MGTLLVPVALDLLRLCAWLVVLLALFVPLERYFALHPQKVFRKDVATDLGYFFLGGIVPKLLLILPLQKLISQMMLKSQLLLLQIQLLNEPFYANHYL